MSVDSAFGGRLEKHVLDLREKDVRDNSMIRLSGAGDCSRKLGYVLLQIDKEVEPMGTLITFQVGHAYHRMVQEWLTALGVLTPELTEFTLIDLVRKLRGTADGFSERLNKDGQLDPAGKRRVFEIKSISNMPREFNGRPTRGAFEALEKPKEHHLDQANCYGHLWNEQHPDDQVDSITFIYVAKDGSEIASPFKVYTVKLSDKRWERLQAKFAAIYTDLEAGELPARSYDPMSPFGPCRWCPYLGTCLDADAPPEE